MEKSFYVYIMASERNGTLYIGVTSNLVRRVFEHREHRDPKSFTAQYEVTNLVRYEVFEDAENAIRREKRLKKWNRLWKMRLIEESNPDWEDLYPTLF